MSEFEQYRSLFVAESRENHENLVKNLLVLENGPDQDAIDEVFRSIHTLKGASASMGFADMERLCHTMEDVFQLIRNGSTEMSEELENILLACTDLIEEMLDDIEAGGDSSSKNPDEQVQALRAWLQQHSAATGTGGQQEKNAVPAKQEQPRGGEECQPSGPPATDAGPEFAMTIVVAPDCMMKDVRALIAIQNLEGLGTIRSIQPSKEAIDEGKFEGTVHLTIASEAGEEALRTAALGTEIASVEIQQRETPVAPSAAEPVLHR